MIPTPEERHGFWRADVLYRLCDPGNGVRAGARSARVRVGLGSGAFAYPDFTQVAVAGWRRTAQSLLRSDGPVRLANGGGNRDQAPQGRHRGLSRSAARPDPDGKTRRLARPGLRRAVLIRRR